MKTYNRLGRLLVVVSFSAASVGLMLASGAAHAADQFWVSLGTYSQLSGAQHMHSRARGNFSQLQVVPSESDIGFVYRLLDGPVYSRVEADESLERARSAGFFDAWLVVKGDSFVMPQGLSEAEIAAGAAADSNVSDPLLADDQYGYGLGGSTQSEYRSDYDSQSAVSATEESTTAPSVGEGTLGEGTLIETAPPGYGLHQLRRDTPVTGSGPWGSRLRVLDELTLPQPPSEPDNPQ